MNKVPPDDLRADLQRWRRRLTPYEERTALYPIAPSRLRALLDERDGYRRAFEESERDLQDTVRELRAAQGGVNA